MTPSCYIVGITGASGSGKTHVARAVAQRLAATSGPGAVGYISEDFYYKDQSHVPVRDRLRVNYDEPASMDHALLVEHLRALKAGRAVSLPQYDYHHHTRSTTALLLDPIPVIIVEGILLFTNPAVRAQLDLLLFVDTPLDVCLVRRLRRDVSERGRNVTSVLQQYKETVRPMYLAHIAPMRAFAQVIVPGERNSDAAVGLLVESLRARVGGPAALRQHTSQL